MAEGTVKLEFISGILVRTITLKPNTPGPTVLKANKIGTDFISKVGPRETKTGFLSSRNVVKKEKSSIQNLIDKFLSILGKLFGKKENVFPSELSKEQQEELGNLAVELISALRALLFKGEKARSRGESSTQIEAASSQNAETIEDLQNAIQESEKIIEGLKAHLEFVEKGENSTSGLKQTISDLRAKLKTEQNRLISAKASLSEAGKTHGLLAFRSRQENFPSANPDQVDSHTEINSIPFSYTKMMQLVEDVDKILDVFTLTNETRELLCTNSSLLKEALSKEAGLRFEFYKQVKAIWGEEKADRVLFNLMYPKRTASSPERNLKENREKFLSLSIEKSENLKNNLPILVQLEQYKEKQGSLDFQKVIKSNEEIVRKLSSQISDATKNIEEASEVKKDITDNYNVNQELLKLTFGSLVTALEMDANTTIDNLKTIDFGLKIEEKLASLEASNSQLTSEVEELKTLFEGLKSSKMTGTQSAFGKDGLIALNQYNRNLLDKERQIEDLSSQINNLKTHKKNLRSILDLKTSLKAQEDQMNMHSTDILKYEKDLATFKERKTEVEKSLQEIRNLEKLFYSVI